MDDVVDLQCPYCFEWMQVYIDPGTEGEMVQDCEVCCRPWLLVVTRGRDGGLRVVVRRAQ